jgi:hypothetical protein
MRFQIDFNRHSDDKMLEELGAKFINEEEYSYYEIELKNFSEMKELEKKIYNIIKVYYSLIVGFDPNTIYLDKDV